LAGYFRIREPARDEAEHLELAWGQFCECGRERGRGWAMCVVLDESPRDRR